MDDTMRDAETHIPEEEGRQGQSYDQILENGTVPGNPPNIALKPSEDRVFSPPPRYSHDKTNTEERYVRSPLWMTEAPPSPENGWNTYLAEGELGRSHSEGGEEHVEGRVLNADPPIKAPMPNVEGIPWFHSNLSRTDAESLLLQKSITEGTYLSRSSQSGSECLTISARSHNFVSHSKVQWDGKQFCFGYRKFSDVEKFQEYFDQQPVVRLLVGDTVNNLQLSHPYLKEVSEADPESDEHNEREDVTTFIAYKKSLMRDQELKVKVTEEHPKCKLSVNRPDYKFEKSIHEKRSSQEFNFLEEKKHYEITIKGLQDKMRNAVEAICQLQQQVNQLRSALATSRPPHPAELSLSGRGMKFNNHPVQRKEVHIQTQIGVGSWGMVAKGVFRGQKVAVKQPHEAILSKKVVERLEREMRIMAAVKHPNLVRFLGGVLDEQACNLQAAPLIILELLDTNLRTAYKQGQVTVANKLSIFQDIAYALHYLHEYQEPIIHRDVSSPNILLKSLSTGIWRAKLSDFGSANLARCSVTIGEGAFMYSAPEMFLTSDPTSPSPQTTKVDVYSYGIVLCEVTAEKMPEPPTYHFLSLLPQVRATWRDIHDLVLSCTKKCPRERPTMATVIDSLCTISLPAP